MTAGQHAGLSAERWSAFTLAQQIIMIGNEMQRAAGLFGPSDRARLRTGYERVLRLTDLTVAVSSGRALRRELLRWRDLVAAQYVAQEPARDAHAEAFRALLQLTPDSARQIPFITVATG